MLLLHSGRACMPSHMEGWIYALPGRKTVPQDGHIRWGPVSLFCIWPAASAQSPSSLPSGTVWWCNMQWSAVSGRRFSHDEVYSKYVTKLVSGVFTAHESKSLKWRDFSRQETDFCDIAHGCWLKSNIHVGLLAGKEAYTVQILTLFSIIKGALSFPSEFSVSSILWFGYFIHLFLFCPQDTDTGKMLGLPSATVRLG